MTAFKTGDRVLASDRFHNNAPGVILEIDRDGDATVRLDAPTVHCYFEQKTARIFSTEKLAPEVSAPVIPKAPADIKPGTRLDQVLKHLLTGKTLTQGEGIILGYGTRVAASVHTLRQRGHNIVTTMKEDLKGVTYAEYRLVTRRPNGNRKAA